MLAKKHSFTCCPAAKHQNTANLGDRHREKPVELFYGIAQASTLAPEIILLGSFATVSVPVVSIIP